jgi:hypothetical protein
MVNQDGITKMNNQEIFDKVATHLFAQGERAHVSGSCRYRTEDGLKCAVGCLIPDEMYSDLMEDTSIHSFPDQFPDVYEYLGGEQTIILLSDLQSIHDWPQNWSSEDKLRENLRDFGEYIEDLDTSILDKLHFPENPNV